MSQIQFHFLISSERGGSNLISRMLNSHSVVNSPSPTHLLRTLIPLNDGKKEWSEMIDLAVELFNLKLVDWNSKITKKELIENTKKHDLAGLFNYIYSKQAAQVNKQVIFIKEVRAYNLLPFIQANYPRSKFIFLVRDPRDMVLSWKHSPIHKGEIVRGCNVWHNDQKRSLIDYFNLKGADKIKLVKYENLVTDTKSELIDICKFLGLQFEDSMLDYHKGDSEKNMSKATDNWKNLDKPLLKDNFNKYRTSLTENEIRYIEYLNYEMMQYLEYTPDFKKLTAIEFETIKKEIELSERSEKSEYLNVPLDERMKREEWMKLVKSINQLNLF